jgi:hypothetical protein
MEACHVGYAQRLVQLHEQMLVGLGIARGNRFSFLFLSHLQALYSTYQQCQAKALLAGPKKASQKA